MATLGEILSNQPEEQRLNQLLNPLNLSQEFNPQGIASLSQASNPLSFQYPYSANLKPLLSVGNNAAINNNSDGGFYENIYNNSTSPLLGNNAAINNNSDGGFPAKIPKNKEGLDSLISFLIGLKIPGFSVLKEILKGGQNYQQFSPEGSIKGGIYNIDGVNVPVEMANDAFNPKTQLNRFDRAKDKFQDSGKLLDLFAASRTGKEFFNAKKILDYQKDQGTVDRSFIDRPKSERNFTGAGKTGMGRKDRA